MRQGWRVGGGVLLLWSLAGCGGDAAPSGTVADDTSRLSVAASAGNDTGAAVGVLAAAPGADDGPLLVARRARIRTALAGDGLIRLEGLDADAARAQDLALARAEFTEDQRVPDGSALLTEVFAVHPLRPSENSEMVAACQGKRCFRVEKYNFARNLAQVAFVDIGGDGGDAAGAAAGQVIGIQNLVHAQPDVTPGLADLAREIASRAPEVRAALGYAPDQADALMAATKTALNRSRCERSRHLCVAPTFVVGERALWAIVDLTELKLVGVRWTEVGHSVATAQWTEKRLQNEVLTRQYCERMHTVERDGWRMDYVLTSSDGLKISDVRFQGRPVLKDAKLVDWHVSYSGTDGFGYSDAVGCPVFSQAAVLAVEPPELTDLGEGRDGFVLRQGYWSDGWPAPCNYNYEQRYEFHADGSFRVVVASLGRGCGDQGTYRPVTRVAFADDWPVARPAAAGAGWDVQLTEGWWQQASATAGAPLLRIGDSRGWELVPAAGQFGDGGRGDTAYVYVTRDHADRDEGQGDLMTIGPCCNSDHRQGPERFIDTPPEPLAGAAPVLWYVAQLENEGPEGKQPYCWAEMVVRDGDFVEEVWPCPSGPLFRVFAGADAEVGHGGH